MSVSSACCAGDTGQTIVLTTKVFETLLYFVEHAGVTLDKDVPAALDLAGRSRRGEQPHPERFDAAASAGRARGENRYIATVARRGYRFVAKVTRRDGAMEPSVCSIAAAARRPSPAARGRRGRVDCRDRGNHLLCLSDATARDRSARRPHAGDSSVQALLPAERNESLELGMAESLISHLSQAEPAGDQSAELGAPLRCARSDPIAAGRELGVDTVLDGSLQRSGDRLRVAARLLRVATGQQLWAQSFDQDFTTIFDVQDTIAARVAQASQVRRVGGSTRGRRTRRIRKRMRCTRAANSPGRGRPSRACCRQSASSSKPLREIRTTPSPTRAFRIAMLCLASSACALRMKYFPRHAARWKRRCRSIPISRSPYIIGAHTHDLRARLGGWGPRVPARAATRSLVGGHVSPAGPAVRNAGRYRSRSADQRHRATARAALVRTKGAAGNFLYFARRYDESIRVCEQVLALDERADNARAFLIRDLIVKGDYARAMVEYDKRPLQMPGSNAHRAQALALSGQRAAALAELDRVLKFSKERYVAAYDIALIYAALADTENTFLWLDARVEDRSTLMVFLAQDPMFDAFHSDPRWNALVQRVGA
jgi:TolB-like protein